MSAAKERIGVVGAGLMGAEIAFVFAMAGHDVLLTDRSEASLTAALGGAVVLRRSHTLQPDEAAKRHRIRPADQPRAPGPGATSAAGAIEGV